MELWTIGFTETTAERFFDRLREAGIERLVDVRLKPSSQLAGFAKGADLAFFLRELCGAAYEHEPRLAPTAELMDALRSAKGAAAWDALAPRFLELLEARRVEAELDRSSYERSRTVLLCSEATPERCHRRLVVEYLDGAWGGVEARHL
jgi:uncharacterized protein (DUF488 family)